MLHSIYANLKGLLLVVGCVYAINVCVRNELVARRESAPTAIDMAEFVHDYQGQQWLSLTGHLDRDSIVTNHGNTWVALVDPDAGPSDPVHVFVCAEAASFPQDASVTVTGAQIFYDPAKLFPNVHRGDPFVMLQAGARPDRPGLNLAMAIFFGAVLVLTLVLMIRAAMRSRS